LDFVFASTFALSRFGGAFLNDFSNFADTKGAAVGRLTFTRYLVFWAVMVIAVGLRVMDFPSRFEIRDMDETGYCAGSLELLEGITPGYKAAPAGPLFWAGWLWVGGEAIHDFAAPPKSDGQLSLAVRPFLALNRALFDNYRDISSLHCFLVIVNVTLAVIAALAAVGLGMRLGGTLGGVLLGGLFAAVPVFLDLSEMSRPYSMAWSFGVISLLFAAGDDPAKARRRWMGTAFFLGLSIGSRIEMLCLLPVVWWILWDRPGTGRLIGVLTKVTLFSLVVAIWVSPWLITHLIGNLRTIATVRFGGPPGGTVSWTAASLKFSIEQGMLPVMLLGILGVARQPAGARFRRGVLGIYAVILLVSLLTGFAYGIHQHGAVFITWFVLLAVSVDAARLLWPRLVPSVAIIAVAFPLALSALDIRATRAADDHDDSVAWIEQHVPAGTTVFLFDGGMRTLLPTPDSSTALWTEVNDDQAWRKKMESGLTRFKLSSTELPRALSEENLIQERGNRRKWFILGGQTDLPIPRYDVRVVLSSPVFGIHDLDAALKSHAGILLWRDGYDIPTPDLGPPLVRWLNRDGKGVKIFRVPKAPDVHPGLLGPAK
jgi:hypothetical protein